MSDVEINPAVECPMNEKLRSAISAVCRPGDWASLATIGPQGWPHVTPMLVGLGPDVLYFSLTGKQKKRNVQRDIRACVSFSRSGELAHVIVWGTITLRHDEQAQRIWEELVAPSGIVTDQPLSFDGTSLGELRPMRYRIYGIDA